MNTATEIHNLALSYLKEEKFTEALPFLQKLVSANPGDAKVRMYLGYTQARLSHFESAIKNTATAWEQLPSPHSQSEYSMRAYTLYFSGVQDNASTLVEQGLALFPNEPKLEHLQARIAIQQKDYDKAEAIYFKRYSNSDSSIDTIMGIGRLAKLKRTEEKAIQFFQNHLKLHNTDPHSSQIIHFQLGNLYDGIQDYGQAFHHYEIANRLEKHSFDGLLLKSATKDTIKHWTRERISQLPHLTEDESLPRIVQLVGSPRSGSTLLEKMLQKHPQIQTGGELSWLHKACAEQDPVGIKKYNMVRHSRNTNKSSLEMISSAYQDGLASQSCDNIFVDKNLGNHALLQFTQMSLANAKAIWTRRNPIDSCLSAYFQNFSDINHLWSNLAKIPHMYNSQVQLMKHWQEVLDLPILEVHYEQVIQNPEKATQDLFKFLDLEWSDDCLSFHESSQPALTASIDQVAQPLYSHAVERWKNYEPYIQPLISGLEVYGHLDGI